MTTSASGATSIGDRRRPTWLLAFGRALVAVLATLVTAIVLAFLVLPMSIGSVVGALAGGYLAAWAPIDALRIMLAAILAVSSFKLWSKGAAQKPD